jgi:hypothetical protein
MINKMKKNKQPNKQKSIKSPKIIEFLESVKSGSFGFIEKSSLQYSRIKEQTENKSIDTEEFFYTMS